MYPNRQLLNQWMNASLLLQNSHPGKSFANDGIESIEVMEPIVKPAEEPFCKIDLVKNHMFSNSYGKVYFGDYVPSCGEFSFVSLHYNGKVSGVQFDRLGGVWIGGTEVLRYTSAEPSGSPITAWTVEKDVTEYAALWKQNQTVVVSLDNIVDGPYTGVFDVSVWLEFYNEPSSVVQTKNEPHLVPQQQDTISAERPADLIIPLSKSNTSYGWLELPKEAELSFPLTLPQRVTRAVVTVFISGHGNDEFWYTNLPSSVPNTNGFYPGGTFKELQILLNDKVVGYEWPFPAIYTGGFNPLLWRPVVAIGAYIVPEMKFDITPFLSQVFQDGGANLKFNVSTEANYYWFVDGNIQVWVDEKLPANHTFQGSLDIYEAPLTQPIYNVDGTLEDVLNVHTVASNAFKASGSVATSSGVEVTSITKQYFYENTNIVYNNGNSQSINQTTTQSSFLERPEGGLLTTSSYPLTLELEYEENAAGLYNFDVTINHGKSYTQSRPTPGGFKTIRDVRNVQSGRGNFGKLTPTQANLQQELRVDGEEGCSVRNVVAANRTLVKDIVSSC